MADGKIGSIFGWGFAPFHYGRWVHWRGNWCWTPGRHAARPVFSPGLVAWIGGPSVSPYQPSGLWEELMARADGKNWTAQEYTQSHGADLYRRTMYTFWKRTSPPPQLVTFDAPDREVCTVRRARTNTPLQALVLMNDPTYVEASRKFAERIVKESGHEPK